MQYHVQQAKTFLEESDAHFAEMEEADDRFDLNLRNSLALQVGEKLCRAANHAISAAAEQRGWPHSSDRYKEEVVRRLNKEHGDETDSFLGMVGGYNWVKSWAGTIEDHRMFSGLMDLGRSRGFGGTFDVSRSSASDLMWSGTKSKRDFVRPFVVEMLELVEKHGSQGQ